MWADRFARSRIEPVRADSLRASFRRANPLPRQLSRSEAAPTTSSGNGLRRVRRESRPPLSVRLFAHRTAWSRRAESFSPQAGRRWVRRTRMRGLADVARVPSGEPPHPSPAVTPVPASRQADWRSDEREPWLASVRPHPRLRGDGFIAPYISTSYGAFGESALARDAPSL